MALLPILEFPDPRLRTVAKPVETFDADLQKHETDTELVLTISIPKQK